MIETSHPYPETLSALETLRLGAAHAYYSVSRALRFDKVASLLQRAELSLDLPVALLGKTYSPASEDNEAAARQVLSHLVHHFHSTPWMTYRSDFTPLPAGENKTLLKTDAGWGCTFRSIQMIAAQTMVRHLLGPDWRWPLDKDSTNHGITESATNLIGTGTPPPPPPAGTTAAAATGAIRDPPPGLLKVLQLFWDVPEEHSPFSIHNLCYYGTECGVFPGRWLGPSTGCRALEASASAASSDQLKGLKIAVLGGTGGGAPVLGIDRYATYFEEATSDGGGGAGDAASPTSAAAAPAPTPAEAEAAVNEENEGGKVETSTDSSALHRINNTISQEEKKVGNSTNSTNGLLLLIPLVLGIGKLNPVYFPQLQAVLAMPHSVGIVGGRPGSSVYVIGCQGESLLYLDPHTIQPAVSSELDWETFSCDVLRTMWLSSLDPSLALGFYCRNKSEYLDLCTRLKALEEMNRGMPLVCVREKEGNLNGDGGGELGGGGNGNGEAQDWEEDEMEEESSDIEKEESFSEEQIMEEGNNSGKEEGEERQDSEFSVVPILTNGGGEGGGSGVVVVVGGKEEEEEEEAEEEMQRRLSELRQQSSTKSVWELI